MKKSEIELKENIKSLRDKKYEVTKQLDNLTKKCEHSFVQGYNGDIIIFCQICDQKAIDLFPEMPFKHIQKLVN